MRTLLDSWHAAKRGWHFMTRPGRGVGYSPIHLNAPAPSNNRKALLLLRHSQATNEIMDYRATGELVKDHAIPVATIREWICKTHLHTTEDVDAFLLKWCPVALLTKGEHRSLDKADLRSAMPDDWESSDTWARYAAIDMLPDPNQVTGPAQLALHELIAGWSAQTTCPTLLAAFPTSASQRQGIAWVLTPKARVWPKAVSRL